VTRTRDEAVLVIGAGPNQVPLISRLAARGYDVVVVDRDAEAPGVSLATSAIEHSTHDAEAVLTALRAHPLAKKLVALACPSTGRPYLTAARCAEAVGLRFPSPSAVETLLDRRRLRHVLGEVGLARRRCEPADHPSDIELPVVVKPASGGGASRGVSVCRERSDLDAALRLASRISPDGHAVIESFCTGRELKLAGLVSRGTVELLLAGQRTFGDDARGLPVAVALGASEDTSLVELETRLAAPLSELCRRLGLHDLPLNVDVIDAAWGLEVIDVDIVLGSLERLVSVATGIDAIEAQVDLCLGRTPDLERRWWRGAATTYLWIEGEIAPPADLRARCEIEAEATKTGSELLLDPWLRRGSVPPPTGACRVGGLVTSGATQEAALARGVEWLDRMERSLSRGGVGPRVVRPREVAS
jgi:biotin carboxylase